jgi:hypothetical protein
MSLSTAITPNNLTQVASGARLSLLALGNPAEPAVKPAAAARPTRHASKDLAVAIPTTPFT